jgi:lambda repressor-like predicted transcriptional regulator
VGVEKLVAEALEVSAETIWPSRYVGGASREHAERLTRNRRALRAMKRAASKDRE